MRRGEKGKRKDDPSARNQSAQRKGGVFNRCVKPSRCSAREKRKRIAFGEEKGGGKEGGGPFYPRFGDGLGYCPKSKSPRLKGQKRSSGKEKERERRGVSTPC